MLNLADHVVLQAVGINELVKPEVLAAAESEVCYDTTKLNSN